MGTRTHLRTEVAWVAAGLALLAALVYGDHVIRGGLLWDDWENGATSHYHYESGFLGPFDLRQAAYRPLLALLLPLPHLVFGERAALHLALALVLAVAAAAAFHVLLRTLGATRPFAIAAAGLALVFPWSDSTRLWATASLNMVAVVLVFAAATISVRAMRAGAPRRRVWLTAAMLAAGILTYEAVAGLVLLLPLLYGRGFWRRWRIEAGVAAAACALVALATTKPAGGPEHVVAMARDGVALLARALAPWGWVPPLAVLLAAATVIALRHAAARPAALSLVALVLAWAPFAPGEAKYLPTAAGVYDRVNIVAGFAIAALVCSLAALARSRAAQAVVVLAVGVGWAIHGHAHVEQYAHAAEMRSAELDAVERAVPDPRPGTVVVAFHQRDWAGPGLPVFARAWDLGGALKLRYGDGSVSGFPVSPSRPARCTSDAFVSAEGDRAPYSRAVLVDVRRPVARRVRDARSCRAALTALRPSRGSA